MINAFSNDNGIGVKLSGEAVEIAQEFAAISREINNNYPKVMEFATLLLKLDAMEEIND